MIDRPNDWLFLSWVKHHGRSAGIARKLGIRAAFVFPESRWLALRYLRSIQITWRTLVASRPTVILVMSPPAIASFVVLAYARLMTRERCRVVLDLHTGALIDRKWRWAIRLTKLMMRRDDAYIVTSSELETTLDARTNNVFVLHDIIETKESTQSTVKRPIVNNRVIVPLSYAPDEPVNQVLAAAELSSEVEWILTGNAPDEVVIRAPGNVKFTGYVSNEEYCRLFLSSAAVVALTSRPLTMQRAGYEAMSYGRPLISSTSEVMRRFFGSAAVYVSPSSSELAVAVKTVLADIPAYEYEMERQRNMQLKGELSSLQAIANFATEASS